MYKICGRNEKQTRSLTCPTFILNLSCPRSHYDITFEPLKSSVEFRDWGPILAFIQDTVTHFWSENTPDELPEYCETKRKRSRTQKQQSGLEVPSRESEKHNKESNNLRASRDCFSSCQVSNGEPSNLKKRKKYPFLSNGVDSAVQSYDTYLFAGGVTTNRKIHNDMLLSGDLYSDEDNYLVNQLPKKDCCSKQVDCFVDPKWQRGSFEMDDKMTMSIRRPLYAHEFRDDADVNQLFSKPCKLSCSKGMSLQDVDVSSENETGSDFNSSGSNMRRKWVDIDEDVDVGDQDDIDQIFQETLPWHSIGKPSWLLSRCTNQHDKRKANSLSRDVNTSLVPGECSDEENYRVSHPFEHRVSSTSELFPRISSSLFGEAPDADHFVDEDVHCKYGKGTGCDYLQDQEGEYFNFDINAAVNWSDTKNCTDFPSNCRLYAGLQGEFREVRGHKLKDSSLANCSDVPPDEMNWLHSSPHGKGNKETQFHQREAKRSHSAPPFHKHRRKCFHLNNLFKIQDGQMSSRLINDDTTFPEISDPKHELRASAQCDFPSKASYVGDFLCVPRLENEELQKKGQWFGSCISKQVEDSVLEEIEDVSESDLKWRKSCQQAGSQNAGDQSTILDVSSGILHCAGDSLVPCSIDKNCLREAKVLQQVDKKFIPVVAGSILAIIDQHAADERIRLEELRKKVLSGEMKQITYLEAEQELVLPEIGYQLLHNYVEQIQSWGWICDFSGPGSRSFAKKLNVLCRQPTAAKLVAVPCILGVSLTDNDLLEFLQQLSDTDGSSTIPPSVLRVLNNKACRGAIMFGDTLLPSECSLIVEELNQTTLCFQCAHGRPTTVPLVNLEALHKQIDKLELCRKGTQDLWHGLCRHEISLDRAAYRLSSATN